MKFPKLRHAGLCNILIFLPALLLLFAIGFNIPLANWGTPKWVLALNFLLGCAVSLGYLILGAFPLLCADQVFFPAAGVARSAPVEPAAAARRSHGGRHAALPHTFRTKSRMAHRPRAHIRSRKGRALFSGPRRGDRRNPQPPQ